MIGIYKITNPVGQIYIGQSKNIEQRFKSHKLVPLSTGAKLKESFLKYGVDNHVFEVIEYCDLNDLNFKENYWQVKLNTIKDGLNMLVTKGEVKKGRRQHYGEDTILVSIRVPVSKKPEIMEKFYGILSEYVISYRKSLTKDIIASFKEKENLSTLAHKKEKKMKGNYIEINSIPFSSQLVHNYGKGKAIRRDGDIFYTRETKDGKLLLLQHNSKEDAFKYVDQNFL
jgi:group I intron endonuclease